MRWLVSDQKVDETLIGRPVLEALGLNMQAILAAAADKHSRKIDVSTLFSDYVHDKKTDELLAFWKACFMQMACGRRES